MILVRIYEYQQVSQLYPNCIMYLGVLWRWFDTLSLFHIVNVLMFCDIWNTRVCDISSFPEPSQVPEQILSRFHYAALFYADIEKYGIKK